MANDYFDASQYTVQLNYLARSTDRNILHSGIENGFYNVSLDIINLQSQVVAVPYSETTAYTFPDAAVGSDGKTYRCLSTTPITGDNPVGSVSGDWADITPVPQTLTDKTLVGSSYIQAVDAEDIAGVHVFDYANGDMQQLTVTEDTEISFSNFVSGEVCSMIIDAVNWGAWTITIPATVLFTAGTAISFTDSGTDRLLLVKDKDDVYTLTRVNTNLLVIT